MWIKQFITSKVITISPRASALEARDIMSANRIRHLPVVNPQNVLLGIISDRDVRSALPRSVDWENVSRENLPMVAEIMTTNPLTIQPNFTLQDALLQFRIKKVGAFPVVNEDGCIVGILSDRDLLNGFIQVLGLGAPGCFIGIRTQDKEQSVKTVLNILFSQGFPIASMLVIRDWEPDAWAIFLYLLTQNRSVAQKAVTDAGFAMIEPLDWFLTHEARPAA